MSRSDKALERKLKGAIRHFWTARETQSQKHGATSEDRDRGRRAAVTGGKQMDGFVNLVRDLLVDAGLTEPAIYCRTHIELPGWFRPEKQWDLLIVIERCLIAAIEFKSQIGPSFGNNYNNRTEEALGSATDIWAAYREGAFKPSLRPWLGYLMLLEEAPASMRPVRAKEPHFKVFPEFAKASYAKRYELLLTKLVRERLYDSACLLLSDEKTGVRGGCRQPSEELSFRNFALSLLARAATCTKA
jgi:hypothetical protein